MSSAIASEQRNALKALAQTPYDVFQVEDAEVIVEKMMYEDAAKETIETNKSDDERGLNEDVSMGDDDWFQCGYCGDYHEDWIQCENKACTIQWYGLDCAGLVEAPVGRWICAMCRPRPTFPNLSGGHEGVVKVDTQPKPKGVAIKKRNVDKPKPRSGWKGWVEIPGEVKEKMQQEVDAQWEVKALAKQTRTGEEIYEGEQKRRLHRQNVRNNRRFQPTKDRESQQTNIPTPWEEDSQSIDDDQLAPEPAATLSNQGKLPLSEPLVHLQDDSISDKEAGSPDEGTLPRYDRESTFEGFSNSEKSDSIGYGGGGTGVVDEDQEAVDLAPGYQSANEFDDADGDLDSEMTDDIESGFDELSVVDEGEEEAESSQSSDQLTDVVSDVDDNEGVERRASALEGLTGVDAGGGSPMETLGVGAMDYTYLDLYGYGPYLVRRF